MPLAHPLPTEIFSEFPKEGFLTFCLVLKLSNGWSLNPGWNVDASTVPLWVISHCYGNWIRPTSCSPSFLFFLRAFQNQYICTFQFNFHFLYLLSEKNSEVHNNRLDDVMRWRRTLATIQISNPVAQTEDYIMNEKSLGVCICILGLSFISISTVSYRIIPYLTLLQVTSRGMSSCLK